MNLKFSNIIEACLFPNRKLLLLIVFLQIGTILPSCQLSHTREVLTDSEVHSTPLPAVHSDEMDPQERAVLLDWCDDFASSKGLYRFRKKKFTSSEVAIRVCIGVNTPRDTILLIEKNENGLKATSVPSEKANDSKTVKTPLIELSQTVDPNTWYWIEASGIMDLDSKKADCLSDPAYDSIVVVLEIRQGESYSSHVASEGCRSIAGEAGSLPRFVEKIGQLLGVDLLGVGRDRR